MNGDIGLSIDDSRFAYSPGETLSGTVAWSLASTPNRIAVRLLWYTTGKGDQDVGVVEEQELDQPQAAERRAFRFVLPTAPHSFSGVLVSLQWAVEVTAEPGGETARVELVIAPGGVEKRLPVLEVPPPELPKVLKPLGERLMAMASSRRSTPR